MKPCSLTKFCSLSVVLASVCLFGQQSPAPGVGGTVRPGGPGGFFSQPDPIEFDDHAGWKSMFDGQTLAGWDGNKEIWRVEDGAIVAESTCEKPVGTTYLVWHGGEPGDFELKAELKGEGAGINTGIQYRSFVQPPQRGQGPRGAIGPGTPGGAGGALRRAPTGPCPSGQPRGTPDRAGNAKWNLGGPQADFDGTNRFTGQYYEGGTGRGIVAWRGQVVKAEPGKKPRLLAIVGDRDALGGYVKIDDWNQLHVIARGNEVIHVLNGHVTAIFIDKDPEKFRKNGLIGLQIEGIGKVNFRHLWIKTEQHE